MVLWLFAVVLKKLLMLFVLKRYKNICWLGIGGTWASALQAEVHMKEKSAIELFSENAAEYVTTGNKRVGKGTIVILSSVTGSTIEMVEGVKKAQADGAKVFGFIDKAEAELAKMVDYVISYPANEQLKFLHGCRPFHEECRRV